MDLGNGEGKDYPYEGESVESSDALSQEKTVKKTDTLKVAVLLTDEASPT